MKKQGISYLILNVLTLGLFAFYMASKMHLYEENKWYHKYPYWLIATLCGFFPLIILLIVFWVQINVIVAKHMHVAGSEIYGYPYAWILCFIFPVVGWVLGIVMLAYIIVWPSVKMIEGSK